MSAGAVIALMMAQQHHRRMQEDARRRRRRREEEEKRRKEEQRKREEEHRKMVEHRKSAPVVCNGEEWQQDRCVKAISMQSCVQDLISTIDMVRPSIIDREEKNYDRKLLDVGFEYESLKSDLDSDIETLKKLGISIDGDQYTLSRLTPINTNIAKPERATESYGNTFTIMNGQPIELNPTILSSEGYYEEKYPEMNPIELEKAYTDNNSRMKRYQKYGKFLKFLLKTKKYLELEEEVEDLTTKHEQCELRKKEMQSFKSLTKEQLLAIKSYFLHLDQLIKTSDRIKVLFDDKALLRYESNEKVYDLTIKEIIYNPEYSELVHDVYDFINKVYSNDEETMELAYELVKGEYPIEISRRFIYDLLIANLKEYQKAGTKEYKKTR